MKAQLSNLTGFTAFIASVQVISKHAFLCCAVQNHIDYSSVLWAQWLLEMEQWNIDS